MSDTAFLALVFAVALLGGGTAAIAGFGIGSLLTPVIGARLGIPAAVALVAIPHALATGVRCWRLRRSIDWGVLRSFGVLSAIGGLAGALAYARVSSDSLTIVLGVLLLVTAAMAFLNMNIFRMPRGAGASALGLASGFFGGLAGNQGGLRTVALLTFAIAPVALVATSTAIGVLVDAARLPVYLWRAGPAIAGHAAVVATASVGVLAGTLLGERLLLGLSVQRFRQIVAVLVGALGAWLLIA